MKLLISSSKEDVAIDVYHLTLEEFGDRAYHPFIATRNWESAEIEISDGTPRGFIKELVKNTKIVPIVDVENASSKVMTLLCEVYPDNAAELRALFMRDRNEFKNKVTQLIAS